MKFTNLCFEKLFKSSLVCSFFFLLLLHLRFVFPLKSETRDDSNSKVLQDNKNPINRSKIEKKINPSKWQNLSNLQTDKLLAWCIVPFDAKKRTPEQRVEMLKRLGIKNFAYDWRSEHLASFEREVELLIKNKIELKAIWFPASLNEEAKSLLAVIEKNHIHTDLWITMNDPLPTAHTDQAKIEAAVKQLTPIIELASRLHCRVGLYNHGGWFGTIRNQLGIIEKIDRRDVGLVYNLHHAQEELLVFEQILKQMRPHLFAINLNGTMQNPSTGERMGKGEMILPFGSGNADEKLLQTILQSGYDGPIGILGHTNDDVEQRLLDNLDGLKYIIAKITGEANPKEPSFRTYQPNLSKIIEPQMGSLCFLVEGDNGYRSPPLTVTAVVRLNKRDTYQIIVASESKNSPTHWELFTMPQSGFISAYLPGMKPDHVSSNVDIVDDKSHEICMVYEANRVRLYADKRLIADQELQNKKGLKSERSIKKDLGIGTLAEGGLSHQGQIKRLRISKGVFLPSKTQRNSTIETGSILSEWDFEKAASPQKNRPNQALLETEFKILDRGKLHHEAKFIQNNIKKSELPPAGNHLHSVFPNHQVTVLDRSASESFLAIKVDQDGNLFVGGRQRVFVYEADGGGGFRRRQTIADFPQEAVIMGLEFRGDDLYVMSSNALYLLKDGRKKRFGLNPKRILWGLPHNVHNSFHCLAWGPEGKLYLNHGDPLLDYGLSDRPDHFGHWVLYSQPNNKPVQFNGSGSVLRMNADGTNVEYVAGGFRGPVGLTFDRNWNIFTNDNDHESRADLYAPCRLMQVTAKADFSWPRGWLAKLSPDRFDILDLMTNDLGRGVPCDLTYYEDPLLPEVSKQLLQCRWGKMGVYRYPLQKRGSTYITQEEPFLQGEENIRPVGITSDSQGRIFVTALYLPGNVVVPYCPSDIVMISRKNNSKDKDQKLKSEPDKKSINSNSNNKDDQLWIQLNSPHWQLRQQAHQQLLNQKQLLNDVLNRWNSSELGQPIQLSLPWLLAAEGSKASKRKLLEILKSPDSNVRIQAIRALTILHDFPLDSKTMASILQDNEASVQLVGLEYCLEHPGIFDSKDEQNLVVKTVEKVIVSPDRYLKQTGVHLLAKHANMEYLQKLRKSPNSELRLIAIMAMGEKWTVPDYHMEIPAKLPLFYPRDNGFFRSLQIFADQEQLIDLRKLAPVGSYTFAEYWHYIQMHLTQEQKTLFNELIESLQDSDSRIQLQAHWYLSLARDSRIEAKLAQTLKDVYEKPFLSVKELPIEKVWRIGPFISDKPQSPINPTIPIDLTSEYNTPKGKLIWESSPLVNDKSLDVLPKKAMDKHQVYYFYFQIQSVNRQRIMLSHPRFDDQQLTIQGKPIAGSIRQDNRYSYLLDIQPGSNELLLRIVGKEGIPPMQIHYQSLKQIWPILPEKTKPLRIVPGKEEIGKDFLELNWKNEVKNGNINRGRLLFGKLGCSKCHAISADQVVEGAPSLTDVRKRFTIDYLVESILLPNRQIAAPFRASKLQLIDGKSLTGLIVHEDLKELVLLQSDTTRLKIDKNEIEDRKLLNTSPMPSGIIKTPQELKDILAYLTSFNPLPP